MADLGGYLIMESHPFGAVNLDMQHSAIHSSTMSEPTVVGDVPAPAEVLIPEARQRQRYRRSAIVVSLMALLAGAVVAVLITLTSSGSGTPRDASRPPSVAGAGLATVLIRPVQCFTLPVFPAPKKSGPLPSCADPLTARALDVTPNASGQGYSSSTVGLDPALAGYPTSARDTPDRNVLLAALWPWNVTNVAGKQKYLLGPSEMRLSGANVGSVGVQKNRVGEWVVTIHLTSDAAATWDRVAQENFHQFLAIDMSGKVVSTSLVQPTRSSYMSFNGALQIPTDNAPTARAVAAAVKG